VIFGVLVYNISMQELLKDKKVSITILILLVVLGLFLFVQFINSIKANRYIGREYGVNTIYVSGEGEVTAVSDIATLNINLSKEAVTAKEAQNLLNESITKVVNYLEEQKIDDKDIKSEYGGISPKYSYESKLCYAYPCPPREEKIVGYTANQSITVKIREVDNANVIKTGLAGIGVTDISGPSFSIDEEESYQAEARSLAIKDAKEKAEVLAKDLGVKLGKVVSFSEGGNYRVYSATKSMEASYDMAPAVAPVPELPKGENKITSNVTITYEIR